MQIVEIPRSKDQDSFELYETADKSYVEIVTAEDYVKVATKFPIYKEKTLEDHLIRNALVKIDQEKIIKSF